MIYLVYATHFDLIEKIKTKQIHSLHFYYHAQNIIAESFLFKARIDYAVVKKDKIVDMINISPIAKGNQTISKYLSILFYKTARETL